MYLINVLFTIKKLYEVDITLNFFQSNSGREQRKIPWWKNVKAKSNFEELEVEYVDMNLLGNREAKTKHNSKSQLVMEKRNNSVAGCSSLCFN